jgi:hypothetical protein
MHQVEVNIRPTERVAVLVSLIRRYKAAPVHELAEAAKRGGTVFQAPLHGGDESDAKLESLILALEGERFSFWLSVDQDPTPTEVILNSIRESRKELRRQQLLGHLESPESTLWEKLAVEAELFLGRRWWLILGAAILLVAAVAVVVGFHSS